LKLLTEGTYWLIHDACPNKKQFRSYFGRVFEWYIEKALSRLYRKQAGPLLPRFLTQVKFLNSNDEACDALLDFGETLTLAEIKGSLLSTREKYSGNTEALVEGVRTKYIRTPGDKKKGVQQLANNIVQLRGGRLLPIGGFSFDSYRRIQPLLIAYESALVAPAIVDYLDDELRRALGDSTDLLNKVQRLIVLSTKEVEVLEVLSHLCSIEQLFVHYQSERTALTTFWDYVHMHYGSRLESTGTLMQISSEAAFDFGAQRLLGRSIQESP
jgi:hypothetical protein